MYLPEKFVLYDTEYTSWEGAQERDWSKPNEHRELVAIGALLVSKKNNKLKILKKIKILFIPRINSKLSDYFINLTGIDNNDIMKEGFDFKIGLNKFLDFCEDYNLFSYGNDYHIFDENIKLYKLYNTKLNKNKFKDIIPFFNYFSLDTSKYSSGTIYKSVNLRVTIENIHDPLFDSLSIFNTIKYLLDNN